MKKICYALIFLLPLMGYSQWTERIVSTETDGSIKIVTADVNNDGFIDVLNLDSLPSEDFAWYRNTDGMGNFASPNILGSMDEGRSMSVGDLDNDGDVDVVGTSPLPGIPISLLWYRNLDGQGNFSSQIIIPSPLTTREWIVRVGDLDNDGDNDLVIVSADFSLSWFENIDGNGTFVQKLIIQNYTLPSSLVLADFDNDGDLDIASYRVVTNMVWFENDGSGNFAPPQEFGATHNGATHNAVADIDGDGDVDIIAGTGATIVWYENTDGQGTFGDDKLIALDGFSSELLAVDMDNDNDIDLLAVFSLPNPEGRLVWYENMDGLGTFSPAQLIAQLPFPFSFSAADLDGDGDIDPITSSQTENTLLWFENNLLSVDDFDNDNFKLYPNPTTNFITIEGNIAIKEVLIYDMLGRELLKIKKEFNKIALSSLPQGVYFVSIQAQEGSVVKKLLKQ